MLKQFLSFTTLIVFSTQLAYAAGPWKIEWHDLNPRTITCGTPIQAKVSISGSESASMSLSVNTGSVALNYTGTGVKQQPANPVTACDGLLALVAEVIKKAYTTPQGTKVPSETLGVRKYAPRFLTYAPFVHPGVTSGTGPGTLTANIRAVCGEGMTISIACSEGGNGCIGAWIIIDGSEQVSKQLELAPGGSTTLTLPGLSCLKVPVVKYTLGSVQPLPMPVSVSY